MDILQPSDADFQLVVDLVDLLRKTIVEIIPSEEVYPGVHSLAVTALLHVAAELSQGLPPEQVESVIAFYQQFFADAVRGYRAKLN